MDDGIMKKGAILSKSVAKNYKPILFAERSEAINESDSGWQFLAERDEFLIPQDAQIWAIGEVLIHDPSLAPFIKMPSGTRLVRRLGSSKWAIANE